MNTSDPTTIKDNQAVVGLFARIATRHWPVILIGTAWLWLFWPMMTGQTVCGFRDSAYLYYPLFQWIDAQWAAGEIPLWNPYCNYGMPVVGDGSSSVFYPGKLVFFCRFLSYPSRYGIYLAMHIPLAAAGTYWLAKTLRATKPGATLAACGYAFGGAVLFQTTNVIFLVSAAWLPIAVCCVWKMVRTREIKWAILAGICCAMMILGGDPQMTYHVGLIAVGTVIFEAWRIRRRGFLTRSKNNPAWRFLFRSATLIAVMVLVTSLLAAVQIIPTYQWSQRSERTNPTHPANLFQAALDLSHTSKSSYALHAMIGEPDGTIDHAYQFSREPWSMLELFWPNFSGKPFPINQRWTNQFPGADRIWIPSVYMGVMVSLFGLMGIRLWGRRRRNVWLTWMLLIFLIGSLGWYGPVWLFNELFPPPAAVSATAPTPGPQVGGVYWLMQMLLPKYFAFRYPAKLFVIAGLALSILAGISLRRVRLKHFAILFSIFAIISLAQFGLVRQYISVDPGSTPRSVLSSGDAFFGTYDSAGCLNGATFSLGQVILVLGFGLGVLFLFRMKKSSSDTKMGALAPLAHIGLVLIALIDVTVANRWMLAEVPAAAFETPTKISSQIETLASKQTDQTPVWLYRDRYRPNPPTAWQQSSSSQRLAEIVDWQRESLYPKHHLQHNVTMIGSFASVWPTYYEQELTSFERRGQHELSNNTIVDANLKQGGGQHLCISGIKTPGIDRTVKISPIIWVDSGQADQDNAETPITITAFSSNRVTAKFYASTSGSLAFGRIAEPGWTARVKNLDEGSTKKQSLVLDRQQETLFLDIEAAGSYEVEFRYLPNGFVIGLSVSLISLFVLNLWWLFGRDRTAGRLIYKND